MTQNGQGSAVLGKDQGHDAKDDLDAWAIGSWASSLDHLLGGARTRSLAGANSDAFESSNFVVDAPEVFGSRLFRR